MKDQITKGLRHIKMKFSEQKNSLERKVKSKVAFTLIELIVIMAVIAILVLLAAPKFLGYTQKAEDAKYIHTAKVIETALDAYLINGGEIGDGLTIVDSTLLNEAATNKNLIDTKGYMVSVDTDTYYELTDAFIKANLDIKLSASKSTPFVIEVQATTSPKVPNAVYASSEGVVIINKEQTLKGYDNNIVPGGDIETPIETPVEEIETPVEEVVVPPDLTKDPKVLIGAGTVTDPYQIWYLEHLDYIRTASSKSYIMMRDLDFNKDEDYLVIANKGIWRAGSGWNSINPFSGTFNGNGNVLNGLFINRTSMYIGLFGKVISGGKIENIGITNCNIIGDRFVGGLVGYLDKGTISSAYTTGKIEGVKGYSGSSNKIGGLVGESYYGGIIRNTYSSATTAGYMNIAGLVGSNWGTITNSYAIGRVLGSSDSGGLYGHTYGTVTNSYELASTSNNYGKKNSADFTSGDISKFIGWSSTIWTFTAGQYPKLAWEK